MAWDKSKCAEGILAPLLNDEIRENWDALEAALTKEHHFSTGELASLQGLLRQGSARCFFQATAPTTRIDGSAFASTDLGSLWIDSNSDPVNQLNILTATTPTWTPVSTEIIAALLKVARTFAEVITFSKNPVFTLGIVANNSYLQGRNAAGAANVDLIKVDGSNVPTLPDASALATSAAPAADAKIANKKYVDDTPHKGGIVQIVNTQTGAVTSCATNLPYDDTIPQNTEGDEVMTLAITPTSVTNKLLIEVTVFCSTTAATESSLAAALFQDATANALACGFASETTGGTEAKCIFFKYYMAAGTTSETTFKVRAGAEDETLTFNGMGAARKYGGVLASSITITEIKV